MLHICYIQNTEQIAATGKAQYISMVILQSIVTL